MPSKQNPVWAVEDERGLQLALHPTEGHARHMAQTYRTDGIEGKVVPLYRAPILTDEEQKAIAGVLMGRDHLVMHTVWSEEWKQNCDTLRNLLERTNHDAAPEAIAAEPESSVPPGSVAAPANTPSEAEIDALEYVVEEGRTASIDDYGILRSWLIRLRPEWESQSYEESDEKRVNTNTNWDATQGECSVRGEGTQTVGERLVERLSITQAMLDDNEQLRGEIANLRLAEEEREAVEWFAEVRKPLTRLTQSHNREKYKDTLRGLLERLK